LGNSESGVTLRLLRTEKRSAGSTTPEAKASDVTLATDFASTPRLRLFLEDLVISGNAKSPAILIGASTTRDLDDATQAIENNPAISCKALLRWQVTCAFFDGLVTVSPMFHVFVNGSPTYVPIGSRLGFVIPRMTGSQETNLIRTLRVQRSFQGKALTVQFAHNIDDISQLLLFGEDRISWSRTATAKGRGNAGGALLSPLWPLRRQARPAVRAGLRGPRDQGREEAVARVYSGEDP
jgi:hypothetical protein